MEVIARFGQKISVRRSVDATVPDASSLATDLENGTFYMQELC
jgi:hypothetical protein